MKCGVVRGLWGDILHQRHLYGRPPLGYYEILKEAKTSATTGEQTDMVYCWGRQNYEFAKYLNLPARLVGLDEYPFEKREEVRAPRLHGMIVWGSNHFQTKWLLLQAALEDFDEVVNVDWDLMQIRKLTPEFWERQRVPGVPFRCVLSTQPSWVWGAYWRTFRRRRQVPQEQGTYGAQHVPFMGCVWTNSREFIVQGKEIHQQHPILMSQQITAAILDRGHAGQWIGVDEYCRRGYQADFLELKTGLLPPADRNTVIWQNLLPRYRKGVR